MDILGSNPMFPVHSRKSVSSLYHTSRRATARLVSGFCDGPHADVKLAVSIVRRYMRKNLPAFILTDLLSTIVPASTDKWRFSCASSRELLHCRVHPECQLVYHKLDKIIRVLFSEDVGTINLNLKTVLIDTYSNVINSLIEVFSKDDVSRKFPLLKSLVIVGGSVHADNLIKKIEELARVIKKTCINLENIHLPVASNNVLLSVSDTMNVRSFKSDRTKSFDKRGLYHLCHPDSQSQKSLQVLHLGVFKHSHFEKQDVSVFLRCMKGLVEFSLMDSDRALVRLDGSTSPGDKVLTYSVFKRAIRDAEECAHTEHGHRACALDTPERELVTQLREMTVVDRNLKPRYLLEHAPRLSRLSIDWQQELSFTPFNRYSASWFSEMLSGNSWATLSSRLSRLDITFPSAHSINSYSLPLRDFTRMMENLAGLRELRLVGAGQGEPVPLVPILRYCPKLTELVLEKSPVHVPDNYEMIDPDYVSASLTRFSYLGEMSSLLVHNFMMRGIAHYMPALIELEVQPQAVLGYSGLTPDQVVELSRLTRLQRLSVPLSIRECIMNLPQIIFVLREFPALRFLTLSWGLSHESYDVSRSKITYMMDWLFNALGAENANIHLQLSYKQHPQEYRRTN